MPKLARAYLQTRNHRFRRTHTGWRERRHGEDFTDLKAIVKKHITDPFDHAFIYNGGNGRECQIAVLLEGWNMKPCACPVAPLPKYGGRNVRPFEKRGAESVQREIVGNADIVCGV